MDASFAERWHRKAGNRATHLVACGQDWLPESAAPCVGFKMAARPRPLWEVFGSPRSWSPAERERLQPYRMIGSDGAGNPICLEQPHVLLDHEDHFHTRQFINSTVAQLAECLLAYMDEHDAERFRAAVRRIDSEALSEGSFWVHEAAWLDVETEHPAPDEQHVNLHAVREDRQCHPNPPPTFLSPLRGCASICTRPGAQRPGLRASAAPRLGITSRERLYPSTERRWTRPRPKGTPARIPPSRRPDHSSH